MQMTTIEERAKARGQKRAASAHYRDLQIARDIAREIASRPLTICADDVRREMLRRFPDTVWKNWAGSIFSGPQWYPVGFTRSTVAGSHANLLRTWRLRYKGADELTRT